jgi:hypothetical protein
VTQHRADHALAGWLVFSHAPDGWGMAGLVLIGSAGALAPALERPRRP